MLSVIEIFVFLLFAKIDAVTYYISSGHVHNRTCTTSGSINLRPCYSLHQLSNNTALMSDKTSVTFLLLSERFTFPQDFVTSNVSKVAIHPWIEGQRVAIECSSANGFIFEDIRELYVFSIKFIHCELELQHESPSTFSPRDVHHINIKNCAFVESLSDNALTIQNRGSYLNITISSCSFASNKGAVLIHIINTAIIFPFRSPKVLLAIVSITGSTFSNNWKNVISVYHHASIMVHDSQFVNNTGPAINCISSNLKIFNSSFRNNSAGVGGAIMSIPHDEPLIVYNSTFLDNSATLSGGAIASKFMTITNCHFENNSAKISGGALYIYSDSYHGDTQNANHQTHIKSCFFSRNMAEISGGAVYCEKYLRTVHSLVLSGGSSESNSAERGGFLYLSGCHFSMEHEVEIVRNRAVDGGGIYAKNSRVIIESGISVPFLPYTSNYKIQSNTMLLANNTAGERGGAMFLTPGSSIKIGLLGHLTFSDNAAGLKGGAIFVLDIQCELNLHPQCFITAYSNQTITFSNNSAPYGSVLYGGLLDQCSVDTEHQIHVGVVGIDNFRQALNQHKENPLAISSDPVRICLCVNDYEIDCKTRSFTVEKQRGQTINLMIVSVDQVKNPLNSTITAHYMEISAELDKGESRKIVVDHCREQSFHIYTTDDVAATLILQTASHCERSDWLKFTVKVVLKNCTIGFERNKDKCTCDRRLIKFFRNITCDVDTQSVERRASMWLRYDREHLWMHNNCPLDYCQNSSGAAISFSEPDEQCANNRSGILCGACQHNYSIALGGSKCLPCSDKYAFIWLVLVFAVAGVALVALLLVCNMTISHGTFNGLIFYANVVSISGLTSLRNCSIHPILTIFIAWLNLDLGVETCFYPGMDTYQRIWLQFAFPLYIVFLVTAILVASYYSSTAMKVFGRNNIAILATLFLLSYSKALKTIISTLSATQVLVSEASDVSAPVLPRGVWALDGNIEYLKGRHVVLFQWLCCSWSSYSSLTRYCSHLVSFYIP